MGGTDESLKRQLSLPFLQLGFRQLAVMYSWCRRNMLFSQYRA